MKELTKSNTSLEEMKLGDLFEVKESKEGIILKLKKHVIIDTNDNHMIMKGNGVGILDFKILHLNPFYKNRDKVNNVEDANSIVDKAEELRSDKVSKSKVCFINKVKFYINNKLKWRTYE